MYSLIDLVKYKCDIESLSGKVALSSAALHMLQNNVLLHPKLTTYTYNK